MSRSSLGSLVLFLLLILPRIVSTQQSVGIVTALKGKAQVTRAATQTALSFKDDLILRDIIDTREKSLARILFGGKSSVTVRELSRLEVREELLPTGAVRSIHELSSGGILVNVVQRLLRSDDEVQIRTPNAVAAIRGTSIFARYIRELGRSIFICLTGRCVVTPQGLPAITLTPNTSVDVTGDPAAGVQAGPVGTVTQAEATEIVEASAVEVAVTEEANQEQTAQAETEQATQLATAVVEAITGVAPTTSEDTQSAALDTTTSIDTTTSTTDSDSPTAPPPPPPPPPILPGGDPGAVNPTSFSNVTITLGENEALFGSQALAKGETLTLDNADITLPGSSNILKFNSSCTSLPCLKIANNSDINQEGSGTSLILVDSEANTVLGDFVVVTDSSMKTTGSIFEIKAGDITVDGVTITADADSSIDAKSLLDISGGSFTSKTTDFMAQFNGSTVTIEDLLKISSSLTASGPLLKVEGGDWTFTGSSLLNVSGGGSITIAGSFLDLTNLDLDLGAQPLARVKGGSTLKNTAGPVIKISGGSLKADALVVTDGSANTITLAGTLLDLTNTEVTLRTVVETSGTDTFTHTLGEKPVIQLTESTLNSSGTTPLFQFNLGSLTTSGDLVELGAGSTLSLSGPLAKVSGGSVSVGDVLDLGAALTTPSEPLLQVTGGSLSASSSLATLGANLTLKDAFLSQSGGTVSAGADALAVGSNTLDSSSTSTAVFDLSGGTLTITGTGSDLVSVNGGSITLGGALLSMPSGTPTVTISGDVLNVASTVTGPSSGSVFLASAGTLSATSGDLLDLASGSALSLSGPLLTVSGGDVSVANGLNLGAALTTPAGQSLFSVSSGSLSASSSLATLGANLTLGGAFLSQSGGSTTAEADALVVGANTLTSGNTPVFDLSGGTLTITGTGSDLVSVNGGTITLGGALLSMPSGTPTVTISGDVLNVAATVAGPSSGSVFLASAGTLSATSGDLLDLASGSALNLSGPLLTVSGGDVSVANGLNLGAALTTPAGQSLFSVSSGSLSASSSLVTLGANLTLGGAFLSQSGGSVSAGADALAVGANTLTSGNTPVFDLSGGTLTITGTGSDLVSVSGGIIETGDDFARVQGSGTQISLSGRFLDSSGSTFTVGESGSADLLVIRDGAKLTGPAKPASGDASALITFDQSTLKTSTPVTTAGTRFLDVRLSGELKLGGPLLVATGSTFTTNADFARVTQKGVLTGAGETALFKSTNSTFNIGDDTEQTSGGEPGDNFFRVDDSSSDTVTGAATVTLKGPLVDDSGSTFTIADSFLRVIDGSTLTIEDSTIEAIKFSNSEVNVDNQFVRVDDGGIISLSGPLLNAANTTFNAGSSTRRRSFIQVRDSDSLLKSTGSGSLVTLNPSTVNVRRFLDVRESAKMETEGPVLKDTGSTFTTEGDFARVTQLGTFTGNGTTALFQFSNSTLNIGQDEASSDGSNPLDNFFRVDDSAGSTVTGAATVTLKGPLVDDSGSTFTIADRFLRVLDGSTLTSTTTSPFITLSGSTVTTSEEFARVSNLGQLITGGNLLNISNGSEVTIEDGEFINVRSDGLVLIPGAALESVGAGNAVNVNNTSVSNETINGIPVRRTSDAFVSLGPNTGLGDVTVSGTDSVIRASGAGTLVTIDPLLLPSGPFLTVNQDIDIGTSGSLATFNIGAPATSEPIASKTNTTNVIVTAKEAPEAGGLGQGIAQLSGSVIRVENGATVTSTSGDDFVIITDTSLAIPGPLLDIANGTFDNSTASGDLLSTSFDSILKTFGTEPLIKVVSGTLNIDDDIVNLNGILSLSGPLLTATGSTLTTGTFDRVLDVDGTVISTSTEPLIQLTNSPFTGGDILFVDLDATVTLSGPLLNATNSNLTLDDTLLDSDEGTLISTTTEPLIQLMNSPFNGDFILFLADTDTVTLSGPLLNATNSNLTLEFSLLDNDDVDGKITSTTTSAFVSLSGGTHKFNQSNSSFGNLFTLKGSATVSTTGLGSDIPLATGGILFKATNEATITIDDDGNEDPKGGSVLNIDTALLEASAPIISLISTTETQTSLTTDLRTIDLIQSKVTSVGPVIALDNGLITVNSGPLIELRSGSNLDVTGDLLSLINGSKITVVDGPLIRVGGLAPTGTNPAKSTLNVSEALVNFGGTGGNTIVVTNSLCAGNGGTCAVKSGIQVLESGTGSISIGPNPIKNGTLGNINPSSASAAIIQATSDGVVDIKAP